jgi:hypothetical protein
MSLGGRGVSASYPIVWKRVVESEEIKMRRIKDMLKNEEALATCGNLCVPILWMTCGALLEWITGLLCGAYGKICLLFCPS